MRPAQSSQQSRELMNWWSLRIRPRRSQIATPASSPQATIRSRPVSPRTACSICPFGCALKPRARVSTELQCALAEPLMQGQSSGTPADHSRHAEEPVFLGAVVRAALPQPERGECRQRRRAGEGEQDFPWRQVSRPTRAGDDPATCRIRALSSPSQLTRRRAVIALSARGSSHPASLWPPKARPSRTPAGHSYVDRHGHRADHRQPAMPFAASTRPRPAAGARASR